MILWNTGVICVKVLQMARDFRLQFLGDIALSSSGDCPIDESANEVQRQATL
jgi:hypothetical protein